MNRELCEFYRDRGYPQLDQDWYCHGDNGRISGDQFIENVEWDEDSPTMLTVVDYPATPDIPGLLAFLREKLPEGSTVCLTSRATDAPGIPFRGEAYLAPKNIYYGGSDPDPTTALALAGKAALEALDDN